MMDTGEKYNIEDGSYSIPEDGQLPSLKTMLDCRRVKTLLTEVLADYSISIFKCKVSYIRYKPMMNCIIAYEILPDGIDSSGEPMILCYAKIYNKDDYKTAVEKSKSHRWIELPDLPPFVLLPEQRTIMYFFPNDCLMDGLRLLSDPKKIQRIIYKNIRKFPEDRWRVSNKQLRIETIKYKPERRIVAKCKTKAYSKTTDERERIKVYIRFYADSRGEEVFNIHLQLYNAFQKFDKISIPCPIAYLADRKVLMMEKVPGKPMSSLAPDKMASAMPLAARAIAGFHNCEGIVAQRKSIADYLDEVTATAESISQIAPDQANLLMEISDRLKQYHIQSESGDFGIVHGDYYYSQILVDGEDVSIIDFDRAHIGYQLSDVGNFCAHLKLGGIKNLLTDDESMIKEFIRSYQIRTGKTVNPEDLDFWTAYSLFQLAVGPFRRLEASWRYKTVGIIEECLKILKNL